MEHAAASRIAHGELVLYNPLSEADLDVAMTSGRETLGFALLLLRRE